ncbi:MAG TPA: hypothetical protein VHO69_03875 [Phototrophicaceae bacterium]|nr:hypothetical protein [Phototrophicaceae bacterium]
MIKILSLLVTLSLISLGSIPLLAQQPDIQTFTTEDGSFSFEYPVGWFVEVVNAEYGPIPHLSVDNLPREERYESPEGINLQISLPRKSYDFVFTSGTTPKEMVAQSIWGSTQPADVNFATPSADGTPQPLQVEPVAPLVTEFMVDGRPAAFAYSTMKAMEIEASQLIIIADLGNDYWVSVSASSFKGGLETIQNNELVILQIVQSMRYTPPSPIYSGNPDLPQVYSGLVGIWQRGSVEFFYPADWYVSNAIMVVFSNKQKNLVNTLPEPGQFIAVLQGVAETRAAVNQMELFNKCNTQPHNWTARKLVAQILGNTTPAQLEQLEKQGITFTQPEVVTVNNVEIVYARQYQEGFEVLQMFVDLGAGDVIAMNVTARQEEMAQFEKQLFAVASTIRYTPKRCDETNIGG